MVIIIDNYDSFTFNLFQFIGMLTDEVKVYRNDQITVEAIEALQPSHIILSPGPGFPENAGICETDFRKVAGEDADLRCVSGAIRRSVKCSGRENCACP